MLRVALGGLGLCLVLLPLTARGQGGPTEVTPQRPTFTSDTSTTAPGTLELEIGTVSSGGLFLLPTTLKYTPEVRRGVFHRMEFSVSFDSVQSFDRDGQRVTQFSDRLGLVIRRPVYVGRSFSFAVAPRASFFLRGDRGARLGATAIGAYGFGLNSVVLNTTWTTATNPSPTNPAQRYDVALDISRTLGESGGWNRIAVFAGVLTESPSRQRSAVSLGQGLSVRVRPNWVVDFALRELGLAAGRRDLQVLVGLTTNLGRPADW